MDVDRNQIKLFMKIFTGKSSRLDPGELNAVRAERWHHVPHGEASSILSAKPEFSVSFTWTLIFKQHKDVDFATNKSRINQQMKPISEQLSSKPLSWNDCDWF